MRYALLAMSLVLAGIGLPVQAQAAGTLMFTATAAEDTVSGGPVCTDENKYALAPTATEGKAYLGFSTLGSACGSNFVHVAAAPFQLSGTAQIIFTLSCDRPAQVGTTSQNTYRAALYKSGTIIGSTVNSPDGGFTCTGPTTTREATIEVPTADTAFGAGDVLSVRVIVFTSGPTDGASGNVHFKVGPGLSRVVAAGLPSGSGTPPAGDLGLEVTAAAPEATAAPGGQAKYNLTASSDAATTLTWSARGLPTGYSATFAPPAASLAANASASTTLTVQVPDGAAYGTVPFNATATAPDGTNSTIPLRLVVSDTATGTTGPTGTGTGTGTGTATGTPTGTGTAIDGTDPTSTSQKAGGSGPMLAGLLALALLASRRRAVVK